MSLLSTEKVNELARKLAQSQEGRAVYVSARNHAISRDPGMSKGYYDQMAWEARRKWANEQITSFHVFDHPITIDGKQVLRSDYPQ